MVIIPSGLEIFCSQNTNFFKIVQPRKIRPKPKIPNFAFKNIAIFLFKGLFKRENIIFYKKI